MVQRGGLMRPWLITALLASACSESPDEPAPLPTDSEENPALASNGTEYLVTWNGRHAIYGARVSTTGEPIDSEAFVIAEAPTGISRGAQIAFRPAVASNGTDFFVVWPMPIDDQTVRYFGRAVTGAGELLPIVPMTSSDLVWSYTKPAIASNGTGYLVAFDQPDGVASTGRNIVATSIDNGVPGGATVLGHDTPGDRLSVASNGDSYLVAWDLFTDWTGYDDDLFTRSIRGARLQGTTVEDVPLGAAGEYWTGPSVASNGVDYFVTWTNLDVSYGANFDIEGSPRATRVSDAGVILDSTPLQLLPPPTGVLELSSNGDVYVATVNDTSGLGLAAIRIADGTSLDTSPIRVTSELEGQDSAAISSDGTNFLVAWTQNRYDRLNSRDAYLTLLSADGTVGATIKAPPSPENP